MFGLYQESEREIEKNTEGGDEIGEWFEKAKQIESEFEQSEPTALDNSAIQQRLDARSEMDNLNEVEDVGGEERTLEDEKQKLEEEKRKLEEEKRKFEATFVQPILNAAILKLEDRFEYLTTVENLFGFLFKLHSSDISLKQCEELERAFTKDGSRDLSASRLFEEIKSFQALVDDDGEKTPLEFLNKIRSLGLEPIYPNLKIALKLFSTLPVAIASAESSFSKLKIIKNYLRTTMSQDRLNNLAMISIESDLLDTIPQETIIENFATRKARQVIFE